MTTLSAQDLILPAAALGPEKPLPPLRSQQELHQIENFAELPPQRRENVAYGTLRSTLPSLDQDGYDRELVERALPSLVLENSHLRATILPSLGGRLYSLAHKASGQELLYRNLVLQPADLALRNAWFAGGVEWNLGSTGHWTGTCSPMHAARVDGPDGTPVLRLWELERTRYLVACRVKSLALAAPRRAPRRVEEKATMEKHRGFFSALRCTHLDTASTQAFNATRY